MYFNFHSSANPGGEIRGQIVPDDFSTSEYPRTVAGVPVAELGNMLNAGEVDFVFTTSTGTVRGSSAVDPARGQYATTSLPGTILETGHMYTILASGRGSTFQMTLLNDRIFGHSHRPVDVKREESASAKSE
jgi:hypothetical protein